MPYYIETSQGVRLSQAFRDLRKIKTAWERLLAVSDNLKIVHEKKDGSVEVVE